MKSIPLVVALTFVNLGIFAFQVLPLPAAQAQAELGILRGRGLEIVDSQGRLRAEFKLEPANETFKMPDGTTGYPQTMIFRLITSDGKPRVKLTTSDQGSGLMLLGNSDDTQAILHADGAKTSLKLRNDEKTERWIRP